MAEDILYLDHPATSLPKAPGVARAVAWALESLGNPGRSAHRFSTDAKAVVDRVRRQVADLVGAKEPGRVVFTSGATMALNLALRGLLRPGDHAITTCFDHNSVLRPLTQLKRDGVHLSIVRRSNPAELTQAVIDELRPSTRLVALNHASNVCGTVLPRESIARAVKDRGVHVLLDAAQTVGHLPIDLSASSVDLVAFGGHKGLLGPPGVGCLVLNACDLELRPFVTGGTGQQSDSLEPAAQPPAGFEPGTLNTPAIAGLGAAIDYVSADAHRRDRERWSRLRDTCIERLSHLGAVRLYVHADQPAVPIVAFNVEGQLPERVAERLDHEYGILTRAGLHCAPLAHRALGTGSYGAVRVGFGHGNDETSVERLCRALEELSA